jgi:hypothetical protein
LDFFTNHKPYPTYLYYNPYTSKKTVSLALRVPSDVFNILTGEYIAKNVSTELRFEIDADDVVSLVIAPARSKLTYDGKKTLINDIVVTYDPEFSHIKDR